MSIFDTINRNVAKLSSKATGNAFETPERSDVFDKINKNFEKLTKPSPLSLSPEEVSNRITSGIKKLSQRKNIFQSAGGFAKEVGQSMARSFVAIATSKANLLEGKDPFKAEFTPTSDISKKILGTEESISFEKIGREVASIAGQEETISTKWAIPLGLVFAGLDTIPITSGKAKATYKAIAKTNVIDDIFKLVRPLLKGSDDDIRALSIGLKDVSDPKVVEQIITKVKDIPVKTIEPLTQEARISKLRLPDGKISAKQATQGLKEAGYSSSEISEILSSTPEAVVGGKADTGFFHSSKIIQNTKFLESSGKLTQATKGVDLTQEARKYKSAEELFMVGKIKTEIPLNKISGLEPKPAPFPTKIKKITEPVEIVRTDMGDFILESGNHRYWQAVFNKDKTIPAIVRFEKQSAIDIYTQATKGVDTGLDALKEEARKYKTAEEFVEAQGKNNPLYLAAKDFENVDDFISNFRGSSTQYGKYRPEIRKFGTTEESARISDLGIDPNKKITIYRGIDDAEGKIRSSKINDGDFVTTDYDSANSYSGGRVISKEVRVKDLITDFPDEFNPKDPFYVGAEFIYSNSKNKLIKYSDSDLAKIFNEAKSYEIKIPLAEWEKQGAYIQKYGKMPEGADIKGYSKSSEYNKYGTTERQRTSAYYEYVSNKIDKAVKTKSQLKDIYTQATKGVEAEYVYHGTNEIMLDSIVKEGLKPSMKGTLSFSKNEAYAKSFARSGITPSGKTEPVMFRVKADLLKGKALSIDKSKPISDQLNEVLTKEIIPPEAIEININGKWQQLTDIYTQATKGVEGGVTTFSKPLDDLIKKNVQEATEVLSQEAQKGAIGFKKDKPIEIKDNAVEDVLKRGRELTPGFSDLIKRVYNGITSEINKFTFESEIKKEFPQLVDDIRTGLIPIPRRAIEMGDVAINSIFAPLSKNEALGVLDVAFLRNFKARAEKGLTLPGDLSLEQVTKVLTQLEGQLSEKQLTALSKTRELLDATREDLVQRGKLEANQEITDYVPHYVSDYLPEWWSSESVFLPRRLREPFRTSTKTAHGSSKDVITDKRALQNHISSIFLDNMIDDWALTQLPNLDKFPELKLSPEEMTNIFGEPRLAFGEHPYWEPRPNRIYEIDGIKYRGFQYVPGRVIYSMATDIETTVPALGRYRKTYLLEEPIYNRFNKLKNPVGDIPLIYNLNKVTGLWKRFTLDTAGLPFQFGNMFGDAFNLYKQNPGAFLEIPKSMTIMKKMLSSKPQQLTIEEQQIVDFLKEKDIVESGFIQSFLRNPKLSLNPFSIIEVGSDLREKLLRVSMGIYQWKRVQAGLPIEPKGIKINGLDPLSAAGKIAREFTVDYQSQTVAERRFLSGLIAPFQRFFTQNTKNWANYIKGKPVEFSIKFVAPQISAWTWNNTGDRKEVEEQLPQWFRERSHIILKSYDINGDGKMDKSLVWSYETPLDLAMAWIAANKIADKVTMIRAGKMTVEEAAKQQLIDMALAPVEVGSQMFNPMIQFYQGLISNQDPFTKRTIIPDRLKGSEEENKLIASYFIEKMALPVAQYTSSYRKGEASTNPIFRWLEAGPLDIKRALGFYVLDLNGDLAFEYDEESKLRGIRNQLLFEVEENYIKTPDQLADKIKEVTIDGRDGIKLSGEEIANRISSPRVIIDMLKNQLLTIKDEEIRNEYEITISQFRKIQAGERLNSIPKSIKNEFLINLFEKNIIPTALSQ